MASKLYVVAGGGGKKSTAPHDWTPVVGEADAGGAGASAGMTQDGEGGLHLAQRREA